LNVVVDRGGGDWDCQGYGDLTSGVPITDMRDRPLVIPAGVEVLTPAVHNPPLVTLSIREGEEWAVAA
jgi:hypothetical protein